MTPYLTHETFLFPDGQFLVGKAANATSQFGEDGLIDGSLERFGIENKWCFEVGAGDGISLSNTYGLRCDGWKALLIEADPFTFAKLTKYQSDDVLCVNERIDSRSMDRGLAKVGAPRNLDFGSLDIDGQDYHAWNGMELYRPRLMLVEFEYGSINSDRIDVDFVPEIGGEGQATYAAIKRLGIEKGYRPLARTLVNLLFVASELL